MVDLPIPPHVDAGRVGDIWRVPYEERAQAAAAWARRHAIRPAVTDDLRLCLMLVDVQNTFCIPGFELFVAGRSGSGAVDDNRRLGAFIYRHLGRITEICPTMDTHQAFQVFHAIFLVDAVGAHPAPFTLVSVEDVEQGRWRFNPAVAARLGLTAAAGQRHLEHYVRRLRAGGKYDLTIWPYHGMLGGIGHALVPAVEEAIFFHGMARATQPDFQVKGSHPLTEHYSAIGPEVETGAAGEAIAGPNQLLLDKLTQFDAVVVAGQAKSHCVAWTINDLLERAGPGDRRWVRRVYLLEDCTSPVVVPGAVDYTEAADAAFARFASAGMHVVRSTEPLEDWPELGQ
jgi:nicotinamidase-related amidase